MSDWLLGSLIIIGTALMVYGTRCAYYNGVNDGYGASVEPSNPGYRKARCWLTKHMSYRWPELRPKTK